MTSRPCESDPPTTTPNGRAARLAREFAAGLAFKGLGDVGQHRAEQRIAGLGFDQQGQEAELPGALAGPARSAKASYLVARAGEDLFQGQRRGRGESVRQRP